MSLSRPIICRFPLILARLKPVDDGGECLHNRSGLASESIDPDRERIVVQTASMNVVTLVPAAIRMCPQARRRPFSQHCYRVLCPGLLNRRRRCVWIVMHECASPTASMDVSMRCAFGSHRMPWPAHERLPEDALLADAQPSATGLSDPRLSGGLYSAREESSPGAAVPDGDYPWHMV
jgi:hypothetical protein